MLSVAQRKLVTYDAGLEVRESEAVSSEQGTRRVLIVQTEPTIETQLKPALAQVGIFEILVARDSDDPTSAWSAVNVAFIDARVSRERTRCTLRALPRASRVIVVGSGASPAKVFQLAQEGAQGYLEPPFEEGDVRRCIMEKQNTEQRLRGIVRCLVGELSLKDAQQHVRAAMLDEALHASSGSRRSAARLLGVTRPAVQRMLRERDGTLGDTGHD